MLLFISKDARHLPNDDRVGILQKPSRLYDTDGLPQAADNDCFHGFDEGRYRDMVERLDPEVVFVTAPDVVGDYRATRRLWDLWRPQIGHLPLAYVAQDGEVSWPTDADALFIGGTTEWKESEHAERLVRSFPRWTHVGRVNTARRARLVNAWGTDSIDGSGMARFTKAILPLVHMASATEPLDLGYPPV